MCTARKPDTDPPVISAASRRRCNSRKQPDVVSWHQVEAAAEGPGDGLLHIVAAQDLVQRVPQVVGRDALGEARVVEASSIAQATIVIEQEDVERACRPVRPGYGLAG